MEHLIEIKGRKKVSAVFDYLTQRLEADMTAYGGSACDHKDAQGNTIFLILHDEPVPSQSSRPAYSVNPYAGNFMTVSDEETTKVGITVHQGIGVELEASDLEEIAAGLNALGS